MSRLIVLVCFFGILCTGCEEIFHPEETSIGIIDNYNELVSAAEGVYGKLAAAINYTSNIGIGSFLFPNLYGDDINSCGASYYTYYGNSNCSGGGTRNDFEVYVYNYLKDNLWKALYPVIVSANNIIVQYDDLSALDQQSRNVLGEIYLIRAYCIFRLTRTYGQIPLIDDIEIDFSLESASLVEIYEFVENDLKKARSLLPENASLARKPYMTPHRGVAKALLAELYLNWAGYPLKENEKYNLAAKEAGEVIDSANFFQLDLNADFAYLWDREHRLNPESLFCIYFADPADSYNLEEINYAYLGYADNDYNYYMLLTGPESPGLRLFFFSSEVNFFNNFPAGYRKEITFFQTIYVPNDYPYYPQIDTGFITINAIDICNRPAYRKFYYDPVILPYEQFNAYSLWFDYYFGDTKMYIYRFAHTLLTYAEAKARSGQLDASAYEAVNRIRRRANNVDQFTTSIYDLSPGLSQEAFADSVVCERAWELAGEPEGRWFDLVRLEKVADLENIRHPQEGGPPWFPFPEEEWFFPAPAEDILLNPNLEK